MLYRVIIKKETDKYYIGKSYDNKKYKILKNDNIKNLNVKQIGIFIGIGLVVIITIGAYILKTMNKGDEDIFLSENEILNSVENEGTDNEEENKILIHITGSVKAEGVVILNSGDRIIDAIEAAGGEKICNSPGYPRDHESDGCRRTF